MSWKNLSQYGFADAALSSHECIKELDDVHQIIDWPEIENMLRSLYASKRGKPAFPPLMMFKALLLQAWYNLSDPALEKQLARDLLFRRFVGLSLSESVPDHSTLWRFRNLLQKKGLLETMLARINAQLARGSMIVIQGSISIVDATVIEAKQSRPKKNKKGESTQDPEAAYTSKVSADGKRKTTYGYKLHANTDEDGFIKKLAYSPANDHDSKHFDEVLTGKESAVYADSAYASKKNEKLLGKKNKILERAYRNAPLNDAQKASNKIRSGIRSTVERVFGLLKLHHGLSKARYMGLKRNKCREHLIAISHNIKCGLSIYRKMQASCV
jgi:IS5 family transposase